MSRYSELKTRPLNRLDADQHFVIDLQKFMTDVRLEANRLRLSEDKWLVDIRRNQLNYYIARVHGLTFGVIGFVIYKLPHIYDEVEGIFAAARAECDFLSGAYQEQP